MSIFSRSKRADEIRSDRDASSEWPRPDSRAARSSPSTEFGEALSASVAESTLPTPFAPISLRENFMWTFAGNVVYAGSQWGMLAVLAKMGSPEMVGQFALGLAVAAPVMMFCNLTLRTVLVTDTNVGPRVGNYMALRLATTALAMITIAVITIGARYRLQTALVVLTIGLAKSFESMSDVIYGIFQRYERMDWIAKSMMLKGICSLVGLGLVIGLSDNLLWGVLALTLIWASLFFAFDLRRGIRLLRGLTQTALRPRWMLADLATLTLTAVPLGFAQMLVSLSGSCPRYFVERCWGEGELGIFAALAYIPVAGNTVINALAGSAFPRLTRHFADRDLAQFRRLLFKLIVIALTLGLTGVLVAAAFGSQVLTLLYRPEYAKYTSVFNWVMITAVIGYVGMFLGNTAVATAAFKRLVLPNCLLLVVAAVASWVLIPAYHLRGAVWTLGAINLTSCAAATFVLFRAGALGRVRREWFFHVFEKIDSRQRSR